MVSAPAPPVMLSSPPPALMLSAAAVPFRASLASVPLMTETGGMGGSIGVLTSTVSARKARFWMRVSWDWGVSAAS